MASSSWLKTNRSKKITERTILVNRKKAIDKIINRISTEFDNNVQLINDRIYFCSSFYSSGLKGRKKSIYSDICSEEEKHEYADTKINSSKSNLQSESNRCQRKIEILDSEITSLDSQIRTAEYNEEQARKKEMEEYIQALKGEELR